MYLGSFPKGMTPADFRRHPIYTLLRDAGYHGQRGIPSKAELDALGLPDDLRSRVLDHCREAAAVHATGDHKESWRLAEERAVSLLEGMPDALRDPDYWAKPDPTADIEDDPAALAARVRNHWR